MPIIGTIASSYRANLDLGAYDPLQSIIVGIAGTTSITFSNIPSTYRHLQLRYVGQITQNDQVGLMRFNNDSGNNYRWSQARGNGAVADAYTPPSAGSSIEMGYNFSTTATFTSTIFNASIIDILEYTSTSKTKTVKIFNGVDYNGGGRVEYVSGLWFATPAAITTISITANAGNFVENSMFALYGVKSA